MPESRNQIGDVVTIPVRVKPGSSRDRVGGSYHGPYGCALVVMVTAPPVEGKATAAVLRAVAKALGVRRAAVTLRIGKTGRDKVLAVSNPPDDFVDRIARLRGNGA